MGRGEKEVDQAHSCVRSSTYVQRHAAVQYGSGVAASAGTRSADGADARINACPPRRWAVQAKCMRGNLTGRAQETSPTLRRCWRRSAYQRAVVVPTASLEALWSAYERFELEGAAKALGRRALDDMRPRHNGAKAAYRLRRKHLEGLDPEQLALPPGGLLSASSWAPASVPRSRQHCNYRCISSRP